MTDGIKSATELRENWLYSKDPDNYDHVVSCLNSNFAAPVSTGLQIIIKFNNNVPKEQWFVVLEAHLTAIGYLVESRKPTTDGSEELRISA